MDQVDPEVSDLDTEVFSAHSTSGAASTAVAMAGMSTPQIMAGLLQILSVNTVTGLHQRQPMQ